MSVADNLHFTCQSATIHVEVKWQIDQHIGTSEESALMELHLK
jgi:hypothetical protein